MPGHNPKRPKFTYTGRVRGTRIKRIQPESPVPDSKTYLEHLEQCDGTYVIEIDISSLEDMVRRAVRNSSHVSRMGPVYVRVRVERNDLGPLEGRAAGPLTVTWSYPMKAVI